MRLSETSFLRKPVPGRPKSTKVSPGLSWKAGVPGAFSEFVAHGVVDLDSIIEKWHGEVELPERIELKKEGEFSTQATTRYGQIVSTLFVYFPMEM